MITNMKYIFVHNNFLGRCEYKHWVYMAFYNMPNMKNNMYLTIKTGEVSI